VSSVSASEFWPIYLARRGAIRRPKDIGNHDIIVTNASLSRGGMLNLRKGKIVEEISLRPKLTTNNAQVLVDALAAGRGVGTAQVLLATEELKEGKLIRVLPDYEIEPTELFLVYPSAEFLRSVVRAFIDFAMPALQRIDGIV
jgi:DNA-binding transcriptional LysR family regulator